MLVESTHQSGFLGGNITPSRSEMEVDLIKFKKANVQLQNKLKDKEGMIEDLKIKLSESSKIVKNIKAEKENDSKKLQQITEEYNKDRRKLEFELEKALNKVIEQSKFIKDDGDLMMSSTGYSPQKLGGDAMQNLQFSDISRQHT